MMKRYFIKGKHYESNLPPLDPNISDKREIIKRYFSDTDISGLNSDHLKILYNLYDKYCFNYYISQTINGTGKDITFGIMRGTNIAGQYKYHRLTGRHRIEISKKIFVNLFRKGERCCRVGGLLAYNRWKALMLIFEHELIHLYMNLRGYEGKIRAGKGKMYYSSHGKLYQELLYRFFGHTNTKHEIGLGDAEKRGVLREDCEIGMEINYISRGKEKSGKIIKVNPKGVKVETFEGVISVPYCLILKD